MGKCQEYITIDVLKKREWSAGWIAQSICVDVCSNYCRFFYKCNKDRKPEADIIGPKECDDCIIRIFMQ